jgi:hypothetical protein
MKIVKAETDLKPVPRDHVAVTKTVNGVAVEFTVQSIIDSVNVPNGSFFNARRRSFIFGVFYDGKSRFWHPYQPLDNSPMVFDISRDIKGHETNYSVFLGYNDGFLGATFKPGFYSPKEQIIYWYALAKTREDYPKKDYFISGRPVNYNVIVDIEDIDGRPSLNHKKNYVLGVSKIKLGQGGIKIGDTYNE